MSRKRYAIRSSWNDVPVWVLSNPPDGAWEKGHLIDKKMTENPGLWKFSIDIIHSGETVTLKTYAIDKYNMEFEWVKRCDKSLPRLASTLSDMTSLSFLNEPEILETLRIRFLNKQIYTNTGPILIAVNPFEKLPIYSNDTIKLYRDAGVGSSTKSTDPHVFQIADRAYHKMLLDRIETDAITRENQVIVVNGESGAGKTESMKHILHYLASISTQMSDSLHYQTVSDEVESQVVASNPLMESFGNAKTLRNNNSSRFGKFIELFYFNEGFIDGATVRTYLLETVRVIKQLPGERNFHVFYELSAGLSEAEKSDIGLGDLSRFRYTNQSGEMRRRDDISDLSNYESLRLAMNTLKIAEHTQREIIQIVVAVLHIGNISFVESTAVGEDAAKFSLDCESHVLQACKLLGVEPTDLMNALGRRHVVIANNIIQKNLNVSGATYARDNFAKTVYDLLFSWIVTKINSTICSPSEDTAGAASVIGILDIFGFEYFRVNSFEQLCINYTNEKLQDHFNYAVFRSEQEVYAEEGLRWRFEEYPDNSQRLDLLENKTHGIFSVINEQLKLPKATDESLAQALYQKCSAHPHFSYSKAGQGRLEFTVRHFASSVTYNTHGMLDKNRSDVTHDVTDCIKESRMELLRHLVVPPVETKKTTPRRRSLRVDSPGELSASERDAVKAVMSSSGGSVKSNKGSGGGTGSGGALRSGLSRSVQGGGRSADSPKAVSPRSLFPPSPSASNGDKSLFGAAGGAGAGLNPARKPTSVASQLSQQLRELMLKVRSMRSHFVRCIKPNQDLRPEQFDSKMVVEQLRCGGVLCAVRVFQAGLTNRLSFESFAAKFACFCVVLGSSPLTKGLLALLRDRRRNDDPHNPARFRRMASKIVDLVPPTETALNVLDGTSHPGHDANVLYGMQMGRTSVFLRATVFEYLNKLRHRLMPIAAKRIQVLWRVRRFTRVLNQTSPPPSPGALSARAAALRTFADCFRIRVARQISATFLIQRRACTYLHVRYLRHCVKAVIRIQGAYRSYLARTMLLHMKMKLLAKIQRAFRGYLYRKRQKGLAAVLWFLRLHNSYIKRRRLISSVILIQALVRRYLVRRLYHSVITLKVRHLSSSVPNVNISSAAVCPCLYISVTVAVAVPQRAARESPL